MNFIYSLYFSLPDFSKIGVLGKILNRLIAMLVKRIFDRTIPNYFLKTSSNAGFGLNVNKRSKKYIVSLTSFPARIDDVWITIETILRQSFKPDEIILWLAESQFPDKKIPESLVKLKSRGLTIKFCKQDIRSHKKYLFALEQFPDDFIITLDDDLYYDRNLIKNLIEIKQLHPTCIATNRAHQINLGVNTVLPYRKWRHNVTSDVPSHSIVQTGGFGTIYQNSDLFKDFNDKDLILQLAFHADDLWLKMMCFLNDKKVVTNNKYNKDPITVKSSQIEKLVTINVLEGGNDEQLNNIIKYYNIDPNKFIN